MDHFELHSEYKPTGDQPQAIEKLVKGFKEGNQFETLLGVTGSGKTFTMANVIQALNKPTLILAHNKTLAAQLYGEFKEFFPENAVEYFVSYYDYYQPEAYVPSSDTYIAKDSAINDEIDKLRLSATAAMSERKDVIIISSVSCIYGLGSPQEFQDMMISLRPGMTKDRDEVIRELIDIQYTQVPSASVATLWRFFRLTAQIPLSEWSFSEMRLTVSLRLMCSPEKSNASLRTSVFSLLPIM